MFTNFRQYLHSQGRSPHTIRSYLSDLRQFARWFRQTNGEDPLPERVTAIDMREYRQYMLNVQRLKASTINRRLAALSVYLEWGKASGRILDNPASDVRGVRQQGIAPRWLDKRAQGRLERAAERAAAAARTLPARRLALRDLALLRLMLNTGLRAGEVCALRVDDVTLGERSGKVRVRAGKGNKAREVPLNRVARKALTAWLGVRPETPDETALFVGQGGEAFTTSALRRRIAILARRAGVDASPHVLRHTFGKRLVDSGVSLEKVAALLGHANLNTTRLYVAPGEQDLRQAVETLE